MREPLGDTPFTTSLPPRTPKLPTPQRPLPSRMGKTRAGRLWTNVRDHQPARSTGARAVLVRYSLDCKAERPQWHLSNSRGVLQRCICRLLSGLYDRAREPLLEAACWAHARRKLFEIHASTDSPVLLEALECIGELYKIRRRSAASHLKNGESPSGTSALVAGSCPLEAATTAFSHTEAQVRLLACVHPAQ